MSAVMQWRWQMRQQAGCEKLTLRGDYFYKDPKGVSNWLLLHYAMLSHEYGSFRFVWELRNCVKRPGFFCSTSNKHNDNLKSP